MTLVVKVDGVALPDGALVIVGPNNSLPGGVQGLPLAAWYGEALTGGYVIDDPNGDFDFTGLHTITAEEDDATRPFISGGWITGRRIERGPYKSGAGRIHHVDFIDINWNFALMVFRASSAKRPAETDIARAAFIQASAPMAFTPSIDNGRFNVTDNPVNFDDSDLVTRYPIEAFNEFAGISGKNFYNYWDNDTEEISIHYDLVGVGPAAAMAISNDLADVGAGVFFPYLDAELDQGPAYKVTGMLLGYRGAYAYGTRQATIDDLSPSIFSPDEFQRDEVYRTDRIGRLETANAQIVSMLDDRAEDTDTIKVTVELPAANVNDAYPGEIMPVTFTHLPGYETEVELPIIRRNVVPKDGRTDTYLVHFELSGQGLPSGPGGGDPGPFPHQPQECNPSVLQTKQGSSLGVNVSATLDEDPTPGNVIVCYIALRGTGAIITPTDFTQIESQQFDDDNQSFSMYYKEVEVGDSATVLSGPGNPSSALRMYLAEITGVNVVLSDSLATSDDTFWGPDWTQDLGTVDTSPGGIIMGGSIIGINPVGTITATPQDGGVTLFQSSSGNHGPGKWFGYKLTDDTDPDGIEIFWNESGSDPAAHGQAGIIAFFECAEGGSSVCPSAGVWVRNELIGLGDGTSDTFQAACPFADGSLIVYVDRLDQTVAVTSYDGETGEFNLNFIPRTTELIEVDYQGR